MSEIRVNTFKNRSGKEVDTTKAWVMANNDATTNSTFNISTGTDHATGQFSYTLTNAFTATK